MSSSCVLFLVFYIVALCCYCLGNPEEKCAQISGCECVFPTGVGINLLPLNKEFKWLNASKDNATFFFHPCSDIPLGSHTDENDCSRGVSACLYNKTSGSYRNLGNYKNATFVSYGVDNYPFLFYTYSNITTAILLRCAFVNESSLIYVEAQNRSVTYHLELQSMWACPTPMPTTTKKSSVKAEVGLSTGYVLVIIFLVFVSVYFIGGAVALKFLRGAEGIEMIPNYDFWRELPSLVKDGATFVLSGCQTVPSYDRI